MTDTTYCAAGLRCSGRHPPGCSAFAPASRQQTHPCLRRGLQALATSATLLAPGGLSYSLLSGLNAWRLPIPCSVPTPGVQALTVTVSLGGDAETPCSVVWCAVPHCAVLWGCACARLSHSYSLFLTDCPFGT